MNRYEIACLRELVLKIFEKRWIEISMKIGYNVRNHTSVRSYRISVWSNSNTSMIKLIEKILNFTNNLKIKQTQDTLNFCESPLFGHYPGRPFVFRMHWYTKFRALRKLWGQNSIVAHRETFWILGVAHYRSRFNNTP